MPIVRIELWPGRPREAKDELVRRVTEAVVETVDCPAEAVMVLLYEVDKADWARAGISFARRDPWPPRR